MNNGMGDQQQQQQLAEQEVAASTAAALHQQHMAQHQLHQLALFWQNQVQSIEEMENFKTHELPLARIKRIMKSDEDVRMISAEAPALFAKAAEIFILELTLRAWMHTEENKRRTLQRNDLAMAITKTDTFDFLIDIVPRDDIKGKRAGVLIQPNHEEMQRAMLTSPELQQYYYQLAQQQALAQADQQGMDNLLFYQQQQSMRFLQQAQLMQLQLQQQLQAEQQQQQGGEEDGGTDAEGVDILNDHPDSQSGSHGHNHGGHPHGHGHHQGQGGEDQLYDLGGQAHLSGHHAHHPHHHMPHGQ